MGIRGLNTYITNNADRFLENYYLKNCDLVIDGCSLSAQLYLFETKRNDAFGGDYDKFRDTIERFFDRLHKCNIKPIVIVDGGFEFKKLRTLYERMELKIYAAQNLTPKTQGTLQVFPLLLMDTMREVLVDLKIHMVVSDFESDHEIAYIARQLNCPVLSFDSDFYIYDVLYVPFPTLDAQIQSVNGVNCLQCQLFRIEKFLDNFGGMDKRLLPLMSTLLGNDYVKKNTFHKFFAQLPNNRHIARAPNNQQHTIRALIAWLSRETLESAVNKVLSRVAHHERNFVAHTINKSVSAYLRGADEMLKYVQAENLAEMIDVTRTYELCDESDRFGKKFQVPGSFIAQYRRGQFAPKFINAITKGILLLTIQKEDPQMSSSHVISLNLIRSLVGLLTAQQNLRKLTLVMRNGSERQIYTTKPNYKFHTINPVPDLKTLLSLPEDTKRAIFCEIVELSESDVRVIEQFPPNWRMHAIAIVYWVRNIEDLTLRHAHISAITLCLLYLNVIDKTIGFHRSEKVFATKFEKQLNQAKNTKNRQETGEIHENKALMEVDEVDNGLMTSFNDALLAAEVFLPYFNYDSRCLIPYDVKVVHAYAQLQTVCRWMGDINDLLGEVFVRGRGSYIHNGTFIYNAFLRLKSRKSPDEYVKLVIKDAGDFYGLYEHVIGLFHELLPGLVKL